MKIGEFFNVLNRISWAKHDGTKIIRVSSKVEGVVLDGFCGTGSTCVAAKKLGRHFVGIELNSSYCESARKRVKQMD